MTALRQRLLEVFEIEYQEHLESIRKILSKADAAGAGLARGDMTETVRRAHSLKGAARAVGLDDVETLAHGLESLFIKVEQGEAPLDRDLKRHVLEALDEIEDCVVSSQSSAEGAGSSQPVVEAKPSRSRTPPATNVDTDGSATPPEAVRMRPTSVRIEATNLDQLLKSAGELHADMLRQRLGSQTMRTVTRQMAALEAQWLALWKQLASNLHRQSGVSGSSRLLEKGENIASQLKSLTKHMRAAAHSQDDCARSLHHHLDDLESRVKTARMVPAESVFGGFRKMVRDLALSEGKQIEVSIEGLGCEADRIVLQRIKDPVMHMLRNAVSHGIEPPAQRKAERKPAAGCIALRVATERSRLSIIIEDDGTGIDFKHIAERAVQLGLLPRAQADTASEEALCQILFQPGFSTAAAVTKISGRGVGLSVAREAVTGLQGTLTIRATPGRGTRIELSLPVSILSRCLLLVSFREQTYALASEAVVKVLRIKCRDVIAIAGRPAIHFNGTTLPLVSIGDVLICDDSSVTTDRENACVVVLRSGSGTVGVVVERLVGVNEFVVRTLDVGGERRPWSGIISTEDGTPCLVLNADAFSTSASANGASNIVFKTKQKQVAASKVVLVVDDSITTRTLEKSILEAHGYRVRLSVDGRDAIAQLRSEPADIVVSDIEMPHLNGFELVRALKADKTLADIPVILVTSRDDPKDRARGLELGAEAYVVKQKFDQGDLLRTIEQMT